MAEMSGDKLRLLAECLENEFMTTEDRKAWVRDLRAFAKDIDRSVLREVSTPKCLVEFCRQRCLVLSPNAEVLRASGKVICEVCGHELREHQMFAYPSGMGHCVKGCDGRFYHL